jgi:hypothetical protein
VSDDAENQPTFESLLDREFRWPRAGDRPFTQSEKWHDNAYIEPHGHGRMVMMMTGYKRAADLMVERSVTDDVDRASLVYPIIFNYRQFIELSLKYLIATYGPTVGVQPVWNSHDLGQLWKSLMEVLDGYGHDDVDQTDPVVAEIVAEFAKVDPKSFSYRYPVDTKGNPIPIAHNELDLTVLADVMEALDGYFSGCDGYLDALMTAGP